MIALLRSQGSKHMHSDPLGLQGYVSEETHSVGSVTDVIMPKSTIS